MAAELALAKSVDDEERRFVQRIIEQHEQKQILLAKFDMDSNASFNPGVTKQVLLLLTEFRLMVFQKKSFIGRKTKYNLRLIDIVEVRIS